MRLHLSRKVFSGSGVFITWNRNIGVSVIPGQTQFTRTPYPAKSSARVFESMATAPLDATYAGVCRCPTKLDTDPRFTMVACVELRSVPRKCLVVRNTDFTFT